MCMTTTEPVRLSDLFDSTLLKPRDLDLFKRLRTDWTPCKGADTRLFTDTTKQKEQESIIAEYCVRCPLRSACCDFAVDTSASGVWGYTQNYRNIIAGQRGKPKAH